MNSAARDSAHHRVNSSLFYAGYAIPLSEMTNRPQKLLAGALIRFKYSTKRRGGGGAGRIPNTARLDTVVGSIN